MAERFAPEVFDTLARGAAETGHSAELDALEANASAAKPDNAAASAGKRATGDKKPASIPDLPEWPNVEWAKR